MDTEREEFNISPKKLHYLVLVIKSSNREFPNNWRHIIIAEALNYCVYHEGLVIKGYLLTNKKLYLIVISNLCDIEDILTILSQQIVKGINEYEGRVDNNFELPITPEIFENMFIKYPLYNPYIIKLITGQKIRLPYYNPYVAWLKHRIHNYNYCSAIDYSGAIGPVLVQTH